MLKATAGGGGMGLLTCHDEDGVQQSFKVVQSRGETLFKNSGLFIERYFPSSHHIEVQVFGNGNGKAIHFGERECSIQRRHQKVIEECPSPFVAQHLELRERLCAAAVRLAESIEYGSAGTIEYLVDDESGNFFFLEMNTRLQVEHGITEMCYDVDLVELMLKQADKELQGKGGLDADYLEKLQSASPKGAAIEARIYAENPAKDYAPSPGVIQHVFWQEVKGSRVDTWIHNGTKVTANYDPLLAKAMVHGPKRREALDEMKKLLEGTKINGPPTNLDFLASIMEDPVFVSSRTMTKFLTTFNYQAAAIDVLAGGAYTLVEDWPGRPTIGRGFSHSGPMDPLAFRIGNALVGNKPGTEGLEITLDGPDLRFLGPAIIAICGAPMELKLDGKNMSMWTRYRIEAGQRLRIGRATGGGCRAYLSIYGGLPTVANWFGSKSTAPMTAVGGYQGRALAAGDLLGITKDLPDLEGDLAVPEHLLPTYPEEWELLAMPGPYDEGFITEETIEQLYAATWTISHNAARGGIRLIGPKPKWARLDGGEGGSHPSNVIEYGYPVGALNWTGDDPCLFPVDAPDFGGFVSSTTIPKTEFWRLGQMKAGNKLKFKKASYEEAITKRREVEIFLDSIASCCTGKSSFNAVQPLRCEHLPLTTQSTASSSAIIHQISSSGIQPLTTYRQGGDDFILIDYGHGSFNLNYRCRAVALYKKLRESSGSISFTTGTLHTGMACGNSLMLYYDSLRTSRKAIMEYLLKLESELGDLSTAKFPSRKFRLPITFTSQKQTDSIQRYMQTQRPYASYLPDTEAFVAKNNAFTVHHLRSIFTTSPLMVVAVGFFVALPIALPIDPRHRIQCPKFNPSRIHTPEGQVGWGGSCMALYNVESPGGYMPIGLSIPGADVLGFKRGYSPENPWMFEDFDRIEFFEVGEAEYSEILAEFQSGRYEYKVVQGEFDMREHNRLLRDTEEEVKEIRARQREAQKEMEILEKKLLEKWNNEKEAAKPSPDGIEELLKDPNIITVPAPLNANVWKVEVREGLTVKNEQIVAVLEAMKLEIAVRAEVEGSAREQGESKEEAERDAGVKVEKVLVKPNDVVIAGQALILLRKG